MDRQELNHGLSPVIRNDVYGKALVTWAHARGAPLCLLRQIIADGLRITAAATSSQPRRMSDNNHKHSP